MVLATGALASEKDTTITIVRAQNSPSLTVHYSGAVAAMAELRVNGESIATRSLSPSEASGDANFTLNMDALLEGPNDIEIRLYDNSGKLIGSQRTTINQDSGNPQIVFLSSPKAGATVRGPVQISVGFGKDLPNSYVSYFVDRQFRTMSNVAPFDYLWDTGRETNGWHEIEAWAVPGESSDTFKSKSIRVFVDNPGGHTYRRFPLVPARPVAVARNIIPAAKIAVARVPVAKAAAPRLRPTVTLVPLTLLATAAEARVAGLPAKIRTAPSSDATPIASGLRDMRPAMMHALTAPAAAIRVVARTAPIYQTIEVIPAATKPAIAPIQPSPVRDLSVEVPEISVAHFVTHIRNTVPVDAKPEAAGLMTALAPVNPTPVVVRTPGHLAASMPVAATHSAITAVVAVSHHVATPRFSAAMHIAHPAKPAPAVAKAPTKASSPIVSISTMTTTFVKVVPGLRLNHRGTFAVVMNGDLVEFDVMPRVDEGVPMAPFRKLVEKEGGVVSWISKTQEVNANADGRTICLQIGTRVAKVDQQNVDLELAPYVEKGRTIVPLSFIQETLKVNVEYDKATGHVLITSIK